MEEGPDTPMETDVSSTTQDSPAAQEPVTASGGSLEVTIEVAGTTIDGEEHENDLNQPEEPTDTQPSSNQQPDKCEIVIDSTSKEIVKPPEQPVKPQTPPIEVLKAQTPSKVIIAHSPMKGQNFPFKVVSGSSKDAPIKVVMLKKSPIKDHVVKDLAAVPNKLPANTSPLKVPKEQTPKLLTPIKIAAAPIEATSCDSTPSKEDSMSLSKENSPAKPTESSTVQIVDSVKSPEKLPIENSTLKKPEEATEEPKEVEKIPEEECEKPTIDNEASNDSELDISSTPGTPQDHNKSKTLKRELQSLINSAKESKIISECNQITSKIRKSRNLETSSPITTGGKKLLARRSSDNSQKSSTSEKSEDTGKRSMRSQNPEFVTKQKLFLSSVNSKNKEGSEEPMSDGEPTEDNKKGSASTPAKDSTDKIIIEPCQVSAKKLRVDSHCWRCHWVIETANQESSNCTVCPRSFHIKCLTGGERTKATMDKNWVCPECICILHAEKSDTRSPAMKRTTLGMLCELLRYALKRISSVNGVEPFLTPVDRKTFPDYDKYVVHPMDLGLISENIDKGLYGSTEAFVGDVSWILHNSIIFNTQQSKLTLVARAVVRACRAELGEIEACPECYRAAHARRPTWFTDVCSAPHVLLWAKLKGFPYWPAKGMSVNSSGLVDVRFFGAHDRAWVPARDCVLYCERDPNNFRTKRQDILDSMQEAEQYIRNISRKFGKFVYPPFKVQFEPSKINEQLKLMIPNYEPDVPVNPIEKKKRPSDAKSKDDMETSDQEDGATPVKRKSPETVDTASTGTTDSEKPKDEENTVEITVPVEPEKTRKRRRSALEEATATVMSSPKPAEKKKRLASAEMVILEPSTPTTDNKESIKKTEQNKANNETPTMVTIKKIKSTPGDKTKSPKPKGSSTPKIFLRTVPRSKSLQRSLEKAQRKAAKRNKSSSSDKSDEKKKLKNKANKSMGNISMTIRIGDKKEDSIVITSNKDKPKPSESQSKENDLNNSKTRKASTPKPATPKPATPKPNGKSKADTEKPGSKPSTPKPNEKNKNDDDTPLATMVKKGSVYITRSPGLPTITDVRSLSQTSEFGKTKDSSGNANKSLDQANKKNETVAAKNGDKPQQFGRVGVRAFARMTSPPKEKEKQKDLIEVEVKAEPIDLDDPERQSEKLDLMQSFSLRPVNAANLREVRITKTPTKARQSPAGNNKQVVKVAEARPRAKKTFPQPRKPDEGRSELTCKNSMVYIPIQPPATMAPRPPAGPRAAPPPAPGPAPAPAHSTPLVPPALPPPLVRTNPPVLPASSNNNLVNTVTTPLMNMGSLPTPTSVTSTLTSSAPTVGQVPTSVHTVPLLTTVNGQWTFSLQPVLSVGGSDACPPGSLVNGLGDRVLPPLAAAEPPAFIIPNPNNIEPPKLQQRPLLNPLDPNTPVGDLPTPSAAGPITAKLNRNAVKLADFFRNLLEDTLERVDDPVTKLTGLQKHLEVMKWNHKQEIKELKHNHELQLAEIRTAFEKERTRATAEIRRVCQTELDAAIKSTKAKQWCANCQQEAQFYCCWNTSYCDYVCQRAHWPNHYAACAQQRTSTGSSGDGRGASGEDRLQPPEMSQGKVSSTNVTVGGKLLPTRVFNSVNNTNNSPGNTSIIVSMVEDTGGNQTVKCVGTFNKPNSTAVQTSPRIINKQLMNSDDTNAKKVVTSGGYLIVGATPTSTPSIVLN